jgi:hypothetical protein
MIQALESLWFFVHILKLIFLLLLWDRMATLLFPKLWKNCTISFSYYFQYNYMIFWYISSQNDHFYTKQLSLKNPSSLCIFMCMNPSFVPLSVQINLLFSHSSWFSPRIWPKSVVDYLIWTLINRSNVFIASLVPGL